MTIATIRFARFFRIGIGIGIALALLGACTRVYYDRRNDSTTSIASPTSPTPTPPAVKTDRIEFRVFGTGLGPVLIKFTNAIDGLTVLSSASLPYIATVRSDEPAIFLYGEASALSTLTTGTLQIQVFVNGTLFREGSASGIGSLLATASGTWRQ